MLNFENKIKSILQNNLNLKLKKKKKLLSFVSECVKYSSIATEVGLVA